MKNSRINPFDLNQVAKHLKPLKKPQINRSCDINSCGGPNTASDEAIKRNNNQNQIK